MVCCRAVWQLQNGYGVLGGIWGSYGEIRGPIPIAQLEGADPQLHHGAVVQGLGGNVEVREEYGGMRGSGGSIGVYRSPGRDYQGLGGEYCGGIGQLYGSWRVCGDLWVGYGSLQERGEGSRIHGIMRLYR